MASKGVIKIYRDENVVPGAIGKKPGSILGEISNRTKIQGPSHCLKKKVGEPIEEKKVTENLKLKNVKPRVDTHWKKSDISKIGRVTRTNSNASNNGNVRQTRTAGTKAVDLLQAQAYKSNKLTKVKRKDTVSKSSDVSQLKPATETAESLNNQLTKNKIQDAVLHHANDKLSKIHNVDADDEKSLILCSEYVNDIYTYFYKVEQRFPIKEKYLGSNREITGKMRAVLINWIHEVSNQYLLLSETYFLTVSIIDRYLQKKTVPKNMLQLVGVTALVVASKYEEIYPPALTDFIYVADDAYTGIQLLHMEMEILKTLEFQLYRPLPIQFLRRYSKIARVEELHHSIAKYFLELSSIEYDFVHYPPSLIAATSLFTSLNIVADRTEFINNSYWTPTLVHYTKYLEDDLKPLSRELIKLASSAKGSKLKSVYDRYNNTKKGGLPQDLMNPEYLLQIIDLRLR